MPTNYFTCFKSLTDSRVTIVILPNPSFTYQNKQGRQRQLDLSEFEASMIFVKHSRPVRVI